MLIGFNAPTAGPLSTADNLTKIVVGGEAMAAELGVPRGLAQLGVTEANIPALAASAMNDACLATNPRAATKADLAALLRAAL